MERHTVEVTFEGEEVSSFADEHATYTLYRTPEDTYFVYLDARKGGDEAVLEIGHHPHGLSEHGVRVMWPDLWEAQGR